MILQAIISILGFTRSALNFDIIIYIYIQSQYIKTTLSGYFGASDDALLISCTEGRTLDSQNLMELNSSDF